MSRTQIDREILDWISEGALAPADDERFERLALRLFAYQYEHNRAYHRLCRAFRVDPGSVRDWHRIPAVPTGAFKEARLATFPPEREVHTFRTSGTTEGSQGELHLDTLALYEASLLATFQAYVRPEGARIHFAVLAPSTLDAPDSSLSHMFQVAVKRLGCPESRFYLTREGWEPEPLVDDLHHSGGPVAVVGTAFAFVHLLDHLERQGKRLDLPEGSRVMETGGFKGRSREVPRDELHLGIEKFLGVPPARIVNQYGMCELGSQFYDPSLRIGRPSREKCVPPWVRTRVVDPMTLEDVASGEVGILVHYDLANTGSVLAVQTSDLGLWVEDGFEVLGRAASAEERGCSIAADRLLGA